MLADALLQRVDTATELARVIGRDNFFEDRPRVRGAICDVGGRFVAVGCRSDVRFGGFDKFLLVLKKTTLVSICIYIYIYVRHGKPPALWGLTVKERRRKRKGNEK